MQAGRRGRGRVPGARELGEERAVVAAVAPEVRGRDRLAPGLRAERERAADQRVARGRAQERGDRVVEVLVESRVVPLEDEVVVVRAHGRGWGQRPAAEGERRRERGRARARRLLLVRIGRSVERVGAEVPARVAETERHGPRARVPAAGDAQEAGRGLRVVAEAGVLGPVPVDRRRDGLADAHRRAIAAGVERVAAVGVARLELHVRPPEVRAARHDVHDAADGVRAPERGTAAREDLDPLDGVERHVEIRGEVAALGIRHGLAVHEEQRPVEVRAADPDVGLRPVQAAPPHVGPEDRLEHVGKRADSRHRGDLLPRHDPDRGGGGRDVEARRDDRHFLPDARRGGFVSRHVLPRKRPRQEAPRRARRRRGISWAGG